MDKGKLYHKINQLKKRLKRSRDNQGHSTPLRDRIRLKRLKELQREVRKNGDKDELQGWQSDILKMEIDGLQQAGYDWGLNSLFEKEANRLYLTKSQIDMLKKDTRLLLGK
jgi:hypothetical protein